MHILRYKGAGSARDRPTGGRLIAGKTRACAGLGAGARVWRKGLGTAQARLLAWGAKALCRGTRQSAGFLAHGTEPCAKKSRARATGGRLSAREAPLAPKAPMETRGRPSLAEISRFLATPHSKNMPVFAVGVSESAHLREIA